MFVNIYLIYLLIRVTTIQKNNLFEMNFRLQYSSCVGKKKRKKKKEKKETLKVFLLYASSSSLIIASHSFKEKKEKKRKIESLYK